MTALPVMPLNSMHTDQVRLKDLASPKGTASLKEGDGLAGGADASKGPSRPDEGASSFKKIFLEKKAERESTDAAKAASFDRGAKERPAAHALAAGRAVRAAVKRTAGSAGTRRPSALKQILARLVEKNSDAAETKPKEKTKPKKNDRLDEAFSGVRALVFRERNEMATKTNGAAGGAAQASAKNGAEKMTRQVVIIDLREKPVEKPKQSDSLKAALSRRSAAAVEPREVKKPADARDAYETKVFYKPGALPDRADSGVRPTSPDPAAAKSDFSSRMAEVMKNDMVKHTGLVLKDGGGGEIHLVLKPESLGSVRIRMNLEDNHIVGKIIVDNNTVKQIMEENLGHLETALQQNGYQAAAFDVSVAGEKRDAPEEGTFSGLVDAIAGAEGSPTGAYESGAGSIYDDSLVNIVL